ncbi:MAG: LPS export ABC transporter periplasmic protein LptC [Bacteroidetes bacterium]|nr:LPS export ABC transporter periplasmic protein LptC [Bacteroidota bacterium]
MVLIIGMLFSCENKIEEVNTITQKENLPAESATEIEIIYSENGKATMKLTAPQLDRFYGDNPYVEFPKGVHVVFYDSLRNPETSLKSNYAINREADKVMEAKYDVVVINEKGEVLNTEHLIWDQNTEKIHTEKFVKITTADEIIMGEGMEADQNFNRYTIKKVTGTINIKDDEDNQIP